MRTPAAPLANGAIAAAGRIGTGDFAADLLAHRTAVAERVAGGRTPIELTGLAAHVALGRHHLLREMPLRIAWQYVFLLIVAIGLGAALVAKIATDLTRGADHSSARSP